jgi:gluconolactonase
VTESPYQVLDERFRPCTNGDLRVETLYEGCRWAEGPAYFAAGRYLVWSDIPNERLLRWDETTGAVGVFRQPSGYTNGNTVDREGRLVSCEHGGRRVTRTEHDGSITVLADSYRGKRFNSPNDVVVRSDGSVWFTDPDYGIASDYEGYHADSEIGGCHVYRIDPDGGVRIVADDFVKPNGLAFSLDERRLYVADTRAGHIRELDLAGDGAVSGSRVFSSETSGVFDGFRLDETGRIWSGAGDGVNCYDPDGTLLGLVRVPELVANVTFGGPRRNRLFICGSTSLYSIMLTVTGARRPGG